LLELLVVMGIIMLFAGLGLTAILRLPTVNKLASAEQAIAGALRQARHTAKSTGNPVVLELVTTAGGDSSIRGTVATSLWSERFEGTQGYDTTQPDNPNNFPLTTPIEPAAEIDAIRLAQRRSAAGRSGAGLIFKNLDPSDLVGPLLTCTLDATRGRVIQDKDGVMVQIAVRMQPIPTWQPLVLVTSDGSKDHTDPPSIQASAFGIAVRWQTDYLQHHQSTSSTGVQGDVPESAGSAPTGINQNATVAEWCAWFGDEVVSSWDDCPLGANMYNSTDNDQRRDFINRIASFRQDAWHQVQFLATADRLTLIVDDVVVADRPFTRPTLPAATFVYAGMGALDGRLPMDPPRFHLLTTPPYPTPPDDHRIMPDSMTLDDLRMLRLGAGTAGRLPQGLSFTGGTAQRILCLPDGRIIIGGGNLERDEPRAHPLELSGTFDEKNDKALITIHDDGTISSELKQKSP